MRRIVTAALSVLLAFSLLLMTGATASANALAGGGYSSSYSGESVFTNQAAGGSGQFSAIFFNDGTQAWAPGVVGLLICLPDKVTCNVASPNAAYASGWFSSTVYATVSAAVSPGQNGFFIYNFTVPAGTAPGTAATFNGDVGLIATGAELRPEGYYQVNTTPAVTGAITISPTSASLPIGGQQQFTATGAPAGSTVSWSVTGGCGAVTQSGLFVATATNSPTQPCSVTASASGLTASAPITVFGAAASISCSATKPTIPADGGNTTTVIKGTLMDANGNVVSNDNATTITYSNNSPTILTPTAQAVVTVTNGVASKTYFSTATSGTAYISLSSGSLTGCNQTITTTAPGAAAKLAASFNLGTISADGTSTSVLEVDVTDANGVIIPSGTGSTDTIVVSQTSGSNVCNIAGSGSATGAAAGGSAFFTVTATTTPGTCAFTASDSTTSSVSTTTATLTTVISGAPNKVVVTGNTSPKTADTVATVRVTVALQDASGNPITTPTQQAAVTAALGTGCSGTRADGSAGTVTVTSANPLTTGSFKPNGASGTGTTNLARFIFTSNFATSGCSVTFSDGANVSSATATIVFTAGGAAGVACTFNPSKIINDGSSISTATVSIVDRNMNATGTGTYSVSFSRISSTSSGSSTQITSSPQTTSNGVATFTVRSTTTAGTDTYRASTTINGATVQTGTSPSGSDCPITVGP